MSKEVNHMPNKEKCLESINIHTGESLKRDLQDIAMTQDCMVGELIRVVLEQCAYGATAKLRFFNPIDQAH